jgi:amino acid adenylation domain-containing protein/non-ribosomal peptide synthase protein (TIGR01720 family)
VIDPSDHERDLVALSAAQHSLWLAQHLAPDTAFTVALYLDIAGLSTIDHLLDVLHTARFENGHTQIRLVDVGGTPMITKDVDAPYEIDVVDMRSLENAVDRARNWMRADFATPTTLSSERLLHTVLLRLPGDRTFLYLRAHHLILDGFGAFNLIRRIADIYSGRTTKGHVPDLDDMAELASIDAKYRRSNRYADDLRYWQDCIGDGIGSSTASTRPVGAPAQPRAVRVPWEGSALPDGPDAAALIAAFALYLSRITDSTDVVLGLPVSGRTTAFLRSTGGTLANVLPLTVHAADTASVSDLVDAVRLQITGALRHQRFQDWDRIVDVEARTFGVFFGPLVNVMPFVAPLDFAGTPAPVEILSSGPIHDVAVNLYPGTDDEPLHVDIQWNPTRYDEAEILRHGRRLTRIMDLFLRGPGDTAIGSIDIHDDTDRADEIPRHGGPAAPVRLLPDLLTDAMTDVRFETRVADRSELDRWSNRLAHRLIADGAGPGSVVAIALPRSIEYVVTLWAVAKTGAAFLPLDPEQPADRLATILAECSVTLGISDSHALPSERVTWIGPDVPGTDPSSAVDHRDRRAPLREDHLAYVVYTSGSTGRPKGVAVTHRGLSSFVDAHRARFSAGLGNAIVLAVASPTFDASIAELLLAAALSARLVVAPADSYAGEPLHRLISDHEVTHAILTPSVLGSLEPDGLDALRAVMTVGEQCPQMLVDRWAPGRSFHNDYGPTEATIWATGSTALDADAPVHIGTPIAGTTAHVLDSRLRDVPAGVPGELYLSGPSLARGYVGRAAATAERFVALADGERMYRTGDRVRWSLDHRLDYLGRNDFQVKVRGARVELGDIDAALRKLDGVRDAVTVVREHGTLVSYVSGDDIDTDELGTVLSQSLPSYMVPSRIVALDALPTTPSGKVDRRALPEPTSVYSRPRSAPDTDAEAAVAAAFSDVLGSDETMGRDDDFFTLGGDSIMSIRLVTLLAERGLQVSAREIFENKTVARIAAVARRGDADIETLDELPGGGVGRIDLTPIVRRLVTRGGSFDRFGQSMLLGLPAGIGRAEIVATLTAVVDRHDMLRARLSPSADGWVLDAQPPGSVDVENILEEMPSETTSAGAAIDRLADSLDPTTGSVLRALWLDTSDDTPGRLLLLVHHIAVDGVSWRIIVADLMRAWQDVSAGRTPELPPVGTSMRRWAHGLARLADTPAVASQRDVWQRILAADDPPLGSRTLDPSRDFARDTGHVELVLERAVTDSLVRRGASLYHGHAHDTLLGALAVAVRSWRARRGIDAPATLIAMEGHGREDSVLPGADTSRTVGWFTTVFPVRVDLTDVDVGDALDGGSAAGAVLRAAKESIAEIPDNGIGFGILESAQPAQFPQRPQIAFNYLGWVTRPAESAWAPVDRFGELFPRPDDDMPADAVVSVDAIVDDGSLRARIVYAGDLLGQDEAHEFTELFERALLGCAAYIDSGPVGGHTPSDFPLITLSQNEVDEITERYPTVTDVWPLTPLQTGLMFHSSVAQDVDLYTVHSVVDLVGPLDHRRLGRAAQAVLDRHENLRTAFVVTASGQPVQVVVGATPVRWAEVDLTSDADPENAFERFVDDRRADRIDIGDPPALAFTLVTLGRGRRRLVLAQHHVLLDGWSMPLLLADLLACYTRDDAAAPSPRPFRDYLQWLATLDSEESLQVWRSALAGIEEPTLVAPSARSHHIEYVSDEVAADLDEVTTARIVSAARGVGVTLNTMVTLAWGLVLGAHTSRRDVVFGATVSGRPPELDGVGAMIGLCINTIAARVRWTPDESVASALVRLHHEQARLLDHHHVDLAVLAAGLFDTSVAFESYPVDRDALLAERDGPTVAGVDVLDSTHYPLSLAVTIEPDGRLRVRATYRPDLFDSVGIGRITDQFLRVLDAMGRGPRGAIADIDLAGDRDRRLVARWNDTVHPLPPATLPELFRAAAARTPNAVALTFRGQSLTYDEFASRVTTLAARLAAAGVGPEMAVAVAIPRSFELFVGVYAVLEAGGHYVPVDLDHPAERVHRILADSGAALGLTVESSASSVPQSVPWLTVDGTVTDAAVRPTPARPGHLAYVIFTSGSTGHPKGVGVTHEAVTNQLRWRGHHLELGPDDTVLHKTPVTFDVSVWELFLPLQVGARIVIAEPDAHRDAAALVALVRAERVTVAHFVPSMLSVFVSEPAASSCTTLQHILASGEALTPAVAHRAAELTGACVHNLYGPTEAAIDVTYHHVAALDTTVVPIGRPVWNTEAHVLDDRLRTAPINVTGELYLAGGQLARGYVGRSGLTAERFVAAADGQRLYRTGDLARWTDSGELEYLGRSDFQVKLRGQRIELGEIDAALRAHPEVDDAVTVVRDEMLVAYVTGVRGNTRDVADTVARRVPRYMVPSRIVVLDAMPVTESGKLDRRALPSPATNLTDYRPPSTPTEAAVARAFAQVLDLTDPVGRDDDFFGLGGNSIGAMQLASALRNSLDVDLPVRVVFDSPTVLLLARAVDENSDAPTGPALVPMPRPDPIPLSFAQQRMWFVDQFGAGESVAVGSGYVMPIVLRLDGTLDAAALDAALRDVVERHEILRTIYPAVDGDPRQKILAMDQVQLQVEVHDGSVDAAESFDITKQIPLRANLVGEVLVLSLHHIAADGWSMTPLMSDLVTAYSARTRGERPSFAPLPVQYADFAVWQTERTAVVEGSDLAYWRQRLAGMPDALDLPTDRPRPLEPTGRSARVPFTVNAATTATLRAVAAEHRATPFMLLHSVFAATLSRWTGSDDIAVGTPIAGRTDSALDDLVGMFVNTLVLRTTVDIASPFTDLLGIGRDEALEAYAHSELPFERLVDELDVDRTAARHPLVHVMIAFQNTAARSVTMPGLTVTPEEVGGPAAHFDLLIDIRDAGEELTASLTYATDLFDRVSAERLVDHYRSILGAVAKNPAVVVGDIPLAGVPAVPDGEAPTEPLTLRAMLADVVNAAPTAPAIVYEDVTVPYAELDERSDVLARLLTEQGAGPDEIVALALPRSIDLVVALWAVTKSGAAFLPLDPTHPTERLRHILTESSALLGITDSAHLNALPPHRWIDVAAVPEDPLRDCPLPEQSVDHLAYVIYTSGSTGVPKGVAVTHRGLHNNLVDHRARLGHGDNARILAVSSPTFDACVGELLIALALQAPLIVAPPSVFGGDALAALIAQHHVTHAMLTPSALNTLDPKSDNDLRVVLSVGEACPPDLVAAWSRTHAMFNEYGPSETTIWATSAGPMQPGGTVTIGRPLRGIRTHALDARLVPVPVGVTGELYLAGDQLARGYIGRSGATAARFVAAPGGSRMYRTGDLVRWTNDNTLLYLGRSDFQVKVRGLRIELGEIDSALRRDPAVQQAVTAVVDEQLVSYVVGTNVDSERLATSLGAVLPRYMVPTRIVELSALPTTTSGKVDRRALPAPLPMTSEFRAPSTDTERIVADCIAEIVGSTQIGLDDDFFQLGGNSLSATRLAARLTAATSTAVPVRTVFDAPRVVDLARAVDAMTGSTTRIALTSGQRPDPVPLSFSQERMWFLNRFDRSGGAYVIPLALRLTGELDTDALDLALHDVVTRHEVLRTVYPESDDGVRQLVRTAEDVPRTIRRVGQDPREVIRELTADPFDVRSDAPIRTAIVEIDATQHVLVVVLHHIAADGWSLAPLTRDVVAAYDARRTGTGSAPAPLPVQYADFAVWQRTTLGDPADQHSVLGSQLSYWRDRLAGLEPDLDLPTDRPRPAAPSFAGDRVRLDIDLDTASALRDLAAEHQATLFMVVRAAFALALSRWSGTTDIVVGTAVAGRTAPELDDLVGMFVNTVVLRTTIDDATSFETMLSDARADTLSAFEHADLPFEVLVDALDIRRDTARHPLVQVMIAFQNTTEARLDVAGLGVEPIDAGSAAAVFDLVLDVVDRPSGALEASVTYARDLFDRGSIERFTTMLGRVLTAVAQKPSIPAYDIDVMTPAERADLLGRSGGASRAPKTLRDILSDAARATPSGLAVVTADVTLTYAELDTRSDGLARALVRRGAGPETVVAVALPRSVDYVVALWAVTKTGAAFVPLDPTHPAERIQHILTETGAVLGVSTADAVLPSIEWIRPDASDTTGTVAGTVHVDQLAYVVYTSGSTGTPKGVAVTHRGLHNTVTDLRARLPRGDDARVLAVASPTFDASIGELLMAVALAAPLVIAPPMVFAAGALAQLLHDHAVTHAMLTPRALETLDPAAHEGLRVVLSVGEECPPELAEAWAPGRALFNEYGPSETTIWGSSAGPLDPAASITIGRPVRGLHAWVLDRRLEPVPVGVTGELYLSGDQLARGYIGAAAQTAGRFVATPSFAPAGTRMYRTGDLVRWTDDGTLKYLGRSDFQVKLRGLRIELGEIDSVLRSDASVRRSVTVVRDDRLVSYVVGHDIDTDHLTSRAAARLPRYMVPAQIVVLDDLPTTTSGKLDRRALPTPSTPATRFRAPVSPTEKAVATAIADVLSLDGDRIGLHDNFFALGGNSLSATRVASRLAATQGVEVPLRALFDAADVAELAAILDNSPSAGRTAPAPSSRPEHPPLSFAQQRMWFVNRFDRGASGYTVPLALRLVGDLDIEVLGAAIGDTVARHEVLRTVYPDRSGEPYQKVLEPPVVQMSPVPVTPDTVGAEVETFVGAALDVTTDSPLRATVLALGPDDHVLVIAVHHIAADGWSMSPLARDLLECYRARITGTAPDLEPLPLQYIDFALWQRRVLGDRNDPSSRAARDLDYWTTRLADLPLAMDLPTIRPRTDRPSHRSGRVPVTVGADLTSALRRLAARSDATLFMVVHAALAVTLARWSASTDVVVGTPTAGRSDPALDNLVGMFVGTVVLRTTVDVAEPFSALLDRSRRATLDDLAHADVPFEHIVDALDPVRSAAHHPLFQVMLAFQNFDMPELQLPGLTVTPIDADTGSTRFDLTLDLAERDAALGGALTYAADLFDRDTIERLAGHLISVLASIAAQPDRVVGDIELVTGAERASLLNRTGGPPEPPETLPKILTDIAAQSPDTVAVVDGDRTLTYAELDARSNRLARALIRAGAGPDVVVATAMTRSLEYILAVWSISKAGAALLPLDPGLPEARLDLVLDESSALLGLTVDALRPDEGDFWWSLDDPDVVRRLGEMTDGPISADEPAAPLHPAHLAYVLYTSGSTGRPKGVAVSHIGLTTAISFHRARWTRPAEPRVVAACATTFDSSIGEMIVALGLRGTLVIAPPTVFGGHELNALLREQSITHMVITPRALDTVDPTGLDDLEVVISAGEAVPPEVVSRWAPNRLLFNDYGPTETTVWGSVSAPLHPDERVTIGTPVGGLRAMVLDSRLEPVPVDVVGELYLSGPQLARGYAHRSALTAERFVAAVHGDPGMRMYRTGDLVRWDTHGNLIYLGRSDFQVKIRGQRIELGEIDAVLAAHSGVTKAATIVHHDSAGDRLVSYVTPSAPDALDTFALAGAARESLPQFMVPAQIIVLDELPLTTSGKLDRHRLPAPTATTAPFRAPVTADERAVADAVADVLGLDRASIGLDDDFFALGGNSLAATRLAAQIRESTAADVPLRAIFTRGSVEQLAAELTTSDSRWPTVTPLTSVGTGTPVFCIHPLLGLAWPYIDFAGRIGDERTVFGVHSPALTDVDFEPHTMRELTSRYIGEIRAVHPDGPFHLVGWSVGGILAHAIAEHLAADGLPDDVASLTLVDPVHSITPGDDIKTHQFETLFGMPATPETIDGIDTLPIERVRELWSSMGGDVLPLAVEQTVRVTRAMVRVYRLADAYVPRPWAGPVLFVDSENTTAKFGPVSDFWAPYCTGPTSVTSVTAPHGELMTPAAVDEMAPAVRRWISERDR